MKKLFLVVLTVSLFFSLVSVIGAEAAPLFLS